MWSLRISRGSPTNPVPSFMQCRPYLDTLRAAILHHLFRNALVVVHSKGAVHISIFRLGYLLACFYLLLFSTTLLQRHMHLPPAMGWPPSLQHHYVQEHALVPVLRLHEANAEQLLLCSLVCTVKGYYDPKETLCRYQDARRRGGNSPRVCFPFLLLQRAFLSHDSLHIRAELQVSAV
ncbi:Protein FAM38A [Pteropus alecto]|uniref:Protein FAM38A n=1 Tax=Pteropus alecto TaxID=9402 RepID=L5JMG0_PTEAL|nr:Protein FAM38A [Pteropus alecto]